MIFGHNWVYTSSGLNPPVPGVHYDTWIGLIFVMGVAYYYVSKDPYRNIDMAKVCFLAKITSATPQLVYWIFFNEQFARFLILPLLSDYIFAVLYWMFLRHAKNRLKEEATA